MDIHCVVTGQNESGKSVIVRHTPVKPVSLALLPGYEFHRLWGSDSVPELPSDGTPPSQPRYFPPKNGFRFGFFTIPPDTRTSVDPISTSSALEEIDRKSTRLNSSHGYISYAVFCLKKKKNILYLFDNDSIIT